MRTRTRLLTLTAVVGGLITVGAWAAGLFSRQSPPPPEPFVDNRWFQNVAEQVGVTFRHFDPATPQRTIAETIGSGVGWLDYDTDGWLDLVCIQQGRLRPEESPSPTPTHRLYRNRGDGTFSDVTDAVGLNRSGFGMGCAVGDYDNDGFDDLAIGYFGRVELLHNVADPVAPGGRRFTDVSAAAMLARTNPHWASSLAWGDLDRDGFLDLYVCNYSEIDPEHYPSCTEPSTGRTWVCPPATFPSVTHRLYRNQRDGTFADVSVDCGVAAAPPAPGLAVTILDLDSDGRSEVYTANDMAPAYLFHNRTRTGASLQLVETAGLAGCALGPNGVLMSGMSAEAADVDGSGRPSLFVSNFQFQPDVLFHNLGGLRFRDASASSRLGQATRDRLGFGSVFLDGDLDGFADLAIANGHVQPDSGEIYGVPYPQAAQFFVGDGTGRFHDASDAAGADFVAFRVGRGLARCDYDNDGRHDLALTSVGGPIAVLRNVRETANSWVGLELVGDGVRSNRSAVGAVVEIEAGGHTYTHFIAGGGSYLSASDRRLTVGLGREVARVDRVAVRWPSGRLQEYRGLPTGQYWRLTEGADSPEMRPRPAVTIRPTGP